MDNNIKDIEEQKKKLTAFGKIIICEIIALIIALIVFSEFVFPAIADIRMLHVKIALHTVMTSICVTILTAFVIAIHNKWKTHKKYVLIPVIFTVFAFVLNVIADSISLR